MAGKAIEEQGHDKSALLDIESMNYEVKALIKAIHRTYLPEKHQAD